MTDQAAIKWIFEDFVELLFVGKNAHCLQLFQNILIFHSLSLPDKSLTQFLAGVIDHNLSNTSGAYNIIALRWPCDPDTFLELLFHASYRPLLAKLVIVLGEDKVNGLLQHSTCVGCVCRLGNCEDTDAMLLAQLLGYFDCAATRATEPVKRIDKDMGDLAFVLFDEVQHALKLFASIGLGALIGAAEASHCGKAIALRILLDNLLLKVQREVSICLLFGRYTGVNDRCFVFSMGRSAAC